MSQKRAVLICLVYILFSCFPSFGKVFQRGRGVNFDDDADALLKPKKQYLRFNRDLVFSANELLRNEATKNVEFTSDSRYEDNDEDNGGPSSEFRPTGYDWMREYHESIGKRGVDTDCVQRKRSAASNKISAEELCAKEKEFFSKLPEVMQNLEKALEKTLRKAQLKGIVTGRIKSLSSLLGKMEKDGITDAREITDIVGLRVTLQTLSDIRKFKRMFLKLYNKNVTEIRCYGTCGPNVGSADKREKRYWPSKGSGYRRLHFKVGVPSLKTEAEIQVGTPYMTLWAEWEHAVVYKGPENLKDNKKVRSYAQKLAQYYLILDNIRDKMNPRCPKALKTTAALDIFSQHAWEVFGKPDDGCNFWNDLRVDMP